jgi:hypothetical protein
MDSYTTMVTYALDLAIITPAALLCAVLVLRGNPMGYVIAVPLLALLVLLAPQSRYDLSEICTSSLHAR